MPPQGRCGLASSMARPLAEREGATAQALEPAPCQLIAARGWPPATKERWITRCTWAMMSSGLTGSTCRLSASRSGWARA